MTQGAEIQPRDLREYFRILRARKWSVAVVTALVISATLAFTFSQTPLYQAQAKVVVNPLQNAGSVQNSTLNLDTERGLILSTIVAARVQQDLGTTETTADLLKGLAVDVEPNTEILDIKATGPDPAAVMEKANVFAQAYVEYRAEQTQAQFEAAAGVIQKQVSDGQKNLRALNKKLDNTTDDQERNSLEQQINTLSIQLGLLQQRLLELESAAAANATPAVIVQSATLPSAPISPNKVGNGVLAVVVGLGLGVGFALLRERLDDRVKSHYEVERRLAAPVIAMVPRMDTWRDRKDPNLVMLTDPRGPVSEAFRTMANNLMFMSSQPPLKTIMVTSALAGDGKTTVSANLAVALAGRSAHVMLVSGDLRRPRIHSFFGLKNEAGLTDVLSGSAEVLATIKDTGIDNLKMIDAGPVPDDPAALLGGAKAWELLAWLREVADYVVIDTPPVLAVADASILGVLVDGTIIVTDATRSSRSALTQTREHLNKAGAHIIGAVYNAFDTSRAVYPYYYNYYSEYYSDRDGASDNGSRSKVRRRRKAAQEKVAPSPPADVGVD